MRQRMRYGPSVSVPLFTSETLRLQLVGRLPVLLSDRLERTAAALEGVGSLGDRLDRRSYPPAFRTSERIQMAAASSKPPDNNFKRLFQRIGMAISCTSANVRGHGIYAARHLRERLLGPRRGARTAHMIYTPSWSLRGSEPSIPHPLAKLLEPIHHDQES